MRCLKCGQENEDVLKYCTNCGKKLKKHTNNPKKKKHISIVLIITAAILVIVTILLNFLSIIRIPFLSKFTSIYLHIDKDTGDNSLYQPDVNHVRVDSQSGIMFIDNIIIAFFSNDYSEKDIQETLEIVDGKVVGKLPIVNQYQIQIAESSLSQIELLCDKLMKKESVVFATYDAVTLNSNQALPNDPWEKDTFSEKQDWNEATPAGNNWWAEAVYAPTAWKYNDRMEKISVGVIDSGVDYEHEDLKNIVKFVSPVNNKDDHGTHVCGIIAAEANNEKGITGLLWNADLLTWDIQLRDSEKKTLENNNETWSTESQLYGGFVILLQKGAKVINLSQGKSGSDVNSDDFISREGRVASQYMYMMLKNQYDFVVVQAAGNGDRNHISVDAAFSGGFSSINRDNCRHDDIITVDDIIDRIIVVGAAKNDGGNVYTQRSTSNAGGRVDICAPGEDVFSTVTGDVVWAFEFSGGYAEMSGTSMATPIVSGIAGMVWAVNPSLTGAQVKQIVCARENTYYDVADNKESNHPLDNTYRLVNAQLSVEAAIAYDKNKPLVVEIDDNYNEYQAGNYLIEINGKIICAKSNAIVYKDSISSDEKKIVDAQNVYSILSNGETIYYVEGFDRTSVNQNDRFKSKKIFKTTLQGESNEVICTTKGYAELIAYQDNNLYYLEQSRSGDQYNYALIKYDISNNSTTTLTTDWNGQIINPRRLGNMIYLYLKSNDSNSGVFRSYDLSSGKANDIFTGIVSYNVYSDEERLIVDTFNPSGNGMSKTNHHTCTFDKSGNMEKSPEINGDYDFQYATPDGKYGLYFSGMNTNDSNLYTVDLSTGETFVSEGDAGSYKGKNYMIVNDLYHPEDIYFLYNVKLYDYDNKTTISKNHEDFEINISKPMWVIDGYIVDSELNTYEIFDDDSTSEQVSYITKEQAVQLAYADMGEGDYQAVYWKNVQYNGKEYFLINVSWKVDNGNGKFHYSHIGYKIVSMDGKEILNADYLNGQVQVY